MNRGFYMSYTNEMEREKEELLMSCGAEVVTRAESKSFGIEFIRDIVNDGDTVTIEKLSDFGTLKEQIEIINLINERDIKLEVVGGINNDDTYCTTVADFKKMKEIIDYMIDSRKSGIKS